jgi:hypothetical protein
MLALILVREAATNAHWFKVVGEMLTVGRNDHSSRSHFVTNLFGSEMLLPLGDSVHLRCDHSQTRVLKLRVRLKVGWWLPCFS